MIKIGIQARVFEVKFLGVGWGISRIEPVQTSFFSPILKSLRNLFGYQDEDSDTNNNNNNYNNNNNNNNNYNNNNDYNYTTNIEEQKIWKKARSKGTWYKLIFFLFFFSILIY